MKYVIIGASAAGISAAKTLRENDRDSKITVFTDEKLLPYSRPIISYYLKSAVEEKNIYLEKAEFYKKNNINVITDAKIQEIDADNKRVVWKDGSEDYDRLLIATGSKPFVPPVKNADGKDNVFTFLNMEMSKKIKKYANEKMNAVVIGAGLIGLKAAEGLQHICKSVSVVELAPKVLPSILDDDASKLVRENLRNNGITLYLGDTVTEAVGKAKITSVKLQSGKELPCDLLVIAVGVRPNTELAEACGARVDRGIAVNKDTMKTSLNDIYAAGDCVKSHDILDGNEKIIALWPNAVRQGKTAALNMCGKAQKDEGSFAVNAIDFFGQRICTCGLINQEDARVKISRSEDSYKRLLVRDNRLVGFVLINCSERAGIYTSIIKNKVDLRTLEGDILESPELMLFDKQTRTEKLWGGVRK